MQTRIIADIAKDIRWDRATKDYAVLIIIDGASQYIGSRQSRMDAEILANGFTYEYLTDTHTYETAAELLMGVATEPRFEVREQSKFATTPEDRGILIGLAATWTEAVAKRDQAIAAGWPAYISTVAA